MKSPRHVTAATHTLGVLLFAAAPPRAKSRWRRSRLARWLGRAAIATLGLSVAG